MKRSVLWIGVLALAMAAPAAAKPKHNTRSFTFSMGQARLGVEVISISEPLRMHLGAPKDAGILVNRVEDQTAAKLAGVQVGDVIVNVGDNKIQSADDVYSALAGHKKGDTIKVMVVRAKKQHTLSATLQEDATAGHFGKRFRMFGDHEGPKVFGFGHDDDGDHEQHWFGLGGHGGVDQQLRAAEKRLQMLEKRLEKLEQKK